MEKQELAYVTAGPERQPESPPDNIYALLGGGRNRSRTRGRGLTGSGRRPRYFSPNDVMRRKGCIGCGGAGLVALMTALAMAVALL